MIPLSAAVGETTGAALAPTITNNAAVVTAATPIRPIDTRSSKRVSPRSASRRTADLGYHQRDVAVFGKSGVKPARYSPL
ncbi:hypothetical protein nbrc107696_42920 [Gordonia spumicola]|uniref:Uncharacterized protein n=1 Tax=Gordonia spumicola TaxID=589161 RepID=A0A7I9VEW4_9ACTN|nr:hypothetical protein nbrc107696_42920 [Gordonia spumicola]